jgi:hypothetical protein
MKNMILPKILQPFYCSDLIRLGKDNDGGYLVNKEDILKSSRLLSFGIGNDISFEEDFVKLNECEIDAYDGTIAESFEFFKGKRFLHKENIGSKEGNKNLVEVLRDSNNIFLKCDIEGSEYDILEELITYSKRFSGIVIEFHQISKYALFNELTNFISKIDLKLIHIHANNNSYSFTPDEIYIPDCVELTFTSSNNIEYRSNIQLPNSLDMPNAKERDDFRIIF